MSLDFTQSPQAILVQQLNHDNPGKNLTVNQVVFGPVMANSDPDSNLYDSVIEVSAVQGPTFEGSFFYKYNRLDLANIFTSGISTYAVGTAVELADLLAAINTAAKLNLGITTLPNNDTNQLYVQGDVMPMKLPQPTAAKPSVNFLLSADANSLLFKGAALLTLTTPAANLAASFPVLSTGLTYTPAA